MNKDLEQAVAHWQRNELDAAEQCCARYLQQQPGDVDAIHLQATIANHSGQPQQAETYLRQALSIDGDFLPALFDLANTLVQLNQAEEAIALFNRILSLQPGVAPVLVSRGNAELGLGRREQALQSYQQAITLEPGNVVAHSNYAAVLNQLNRYEDALAAYDKALQINPDHIDALNGRGVTRLALGQFGQALEDYTHAIAVNPGHALSHVNKSFCHLVCGELQKGWPEYEWRSSKVYAEQVRQFHQPQWTGEQDVRGKTVLLHPEQGLGDTIHFCRYAKLLQQRGANVILFVQPPLKPLLQTIPGIHSVITADEPLPAFDYQCTYLSLPFAFATSLDSIPAYDYYLSAEAGKLANWKQRLGDKTGLRIGIAWRGSNVHMNDHNRSVELASLMAVLPGNASLFSLQKDLGPGDREALEQFPQLVHLGDRLADFADTAAVASLMDLVITVDTSVAHLSASIGRPTWVLLASLPDWRWLLDRSDSPWYPSVRLFRQSQAGDWNSVFQSIAAALPGLDKTSA